MYDVRTIISFASIHEENIFEGLKNQEKKMYVKCKGILMGNSFILDKLSFFFSPLDR